MKNISQAGFLKLTKRTLTTFLIISTLFFGTGLIYLFGPWSKSVEAAWFNEDWGYRKRIDVTVTSSGSDVTNADTILTVDTTGITANLQTNCEDLRFTNQGGLILPSYLISCNDNSATNKVVVRVDLIPKNTTTYTLYMYYGNASAPSGNEATMTGLYSGLNGYWQMDESAANTCTGGTNDSCDSSGNGNDGAWQGGATTTATSKFGRATTYDNTTDYITVGNPASLQITGALTLSAWVNRTDTNGQDTIVAKGDYGNIGYALVAAFNGKLFFYCGSGCVDGNNFLSSTTDITQGGWQHVVVVFVPSTSVTMYINGVLNTSTTTGVPSTLDSAKNFCIGAFLCDSADTMDGKIDEVRVYNRALSATDVSNLYNTTVAATPSTSFATAEKAPQPMAYWKMDDGTGTALQDTTTTNADGALTGSPAPTWQTEDQCLSGKCVYFGGSTSRATVATSLTGVSSVAFWVRPTAVATVGLMDFDGGTHKISVSSGTISATGFTSPTIYVNGKVSSTLLTNQWQFVEITTGTGFTGSAIKLGFDNTNYLTGFMDDVKIYNYARTAVQVQADFNARGNPQGAAGVLGASTNQPGALSNGLVGYWKLDEASGQTKNCTATPFVDSSGNGNNGMSCPSTTGPDGGAAGKFGNGVSFDGSNDYIMASPSKTGRTFVTVAGWVNFDDSDNVNNVDKTHSLFGWGNEFGISFRSYTSEPGVGYFIIAGGSSTNGSTNNLVASYVLPAKLSSWHHLAASYDGAQTKLYLDGVLVGSGAFADTGIKDNTRNFTLGTSDNQTPAQWWDGKLDDVRVYYRALSDSEVLRLYNFAAGPVAYWKMDEKSGASAFDASGNSNTGALTNGPTWKSGKYGTGINFDGVDDFIGVTGSSTSLSTGMGTNFTIEAWINPPDGASGHYISRRSGSLFIGMRDSSFFIRDASGNSIAPAFTAVSNTWNHVVGVKSGNTFYTYLNGVLVHTDDASALGSMTTTADVQLGGEGGASNNIRGEIDEVKIYNYARTGGQVIEDMNAGHPAPGSPIGTALGKWRFDEGYGTTAHNDGNQGAALNGTLSGATTPTWSLAGKAGKALAFNGSTAYVTGSDSTLPATNAPRTITAWINPTALPGSGIGMAVFSYGTNSTNHGQGLSLQNNSGTQVVRFFGWGNDFDTTYTMPTATWSHVAASFDGTTAKVYVNGNQIGSSTSFSAWSTTLANFYIGRNLVSDSFFNGSIDEVKVYGSALTADQVKVDMNQGQAQVLGAAGNKSTYAAGAANQEYCVPGDSATCAGPVGRWDFNEGSGNVQDSSGNGNTGTVSNTTYTSGKVGKALNFNGTNASVTVANESNFDFAGSFTLETWIKWRSWPGVDWNGIITKGDSSWRLSRDTATNNLKLSVDGTTNDVSTTTSIVNGLWHHIVAIYDASAGKKYIYVDGKLDASSTGVTGTTSQNNYAVAFGTNLETGGRYWDGQMDQIRIFNYARTPAQVAWDYNRGGAVGAWRMDECQGTAIHDDSGNSNTGTLTIGAGAGTGHQDSVGNCSTSATTAWYNGRTGKRNYSVNFDGIDDYVSVASSTSLNPTAAVSLEAWVKPVSGFNAVYAEILNKALTTANADRQYSLETEQTTGNPGICVYSGSNEYCQYASSPLVAGNWYHLVGVYDGTNLKIYVNGTLLGTGSGPASINTSAGILAIGRLGSAAVADYWEGQIDEAKIYNYALTASQVKTVYNNGSLNFAPVTGAP